MPRKNRKNIAPAAPAADAAPVTPADVANIVSAALAATNTYSAPIDADAGIDAAHAAAAHIANPDAPPAAPRPRHRSIGSLASGDRHDATPVRTLSLAARFASLSLDPAPFSFSGGYLNVSPPCAAFDAAILDPDAPGYVSLPFTRSRAALVLAAELLGYAADTSFLPAPLLRCVMTAYAHDRAMRSTRTRPVGYFDANGISALDLRASLARAAARLAGLSVAGLGTNAACDVTIPDLRTTVAARIAALDAPTP